MCTARRRHGPCPRGRLSPQVVGQGALRCSALGSPPPHRSRVHPRPALCSNGPPPLPYSAVVARTTSPPLGITILTNYSTAPYY
ncbi:unnamed protein product [Arctia plantaginis]|uniref:Uncharacterized protein n=1 Tax=Arctia plantaginis TaxID=874455 RepID=A0A8S0ZDB8_ARCPL|nr:unnamed protein product [Arctia plantaginis]